MRGFGPWSRHLALRVVWLTWSVVTVALGQGLAVSEDALTLEPPPSLGDLAGRPVDRIVIETQGGRWDDPVALKRVRVGDTLSPRLARRALRELTDSGRFADVRAEAALERGQVVLRLIVLPRRIVDAIKVLGGALDSGDTLRAAGLEVESEITVPRLFDIARAAERYYAAHGYPAASVRTDVIDTDDAMRVVVLVHVTPGEPSLVGSRHFVLTPTQTPDLVAQVREYTLGVGDRVDQEALDAADAELQASLRARGWHRATVKHKTQGRGAVSRLVVEVASGPRIEVVFEGVRSFDTDELRDALGLDEREDRSGPALAVTLQEYYEARGYLDMEVSTEELGTVHDPVHWLRMTVREHQRVRVVAREFPCLTGERSADDVGAEIDSFLSEALPGAGVFGSVDAKAVDDRLGPRSPTGARPTPEPLNPWNTYVADVYERAIEHLQELYRSEGYLSAAVGPVEVMRRRCDPRSPPGLCQPLGERQRPVTTCPKDALELPVDDPPPSEDASCRGDSSRGIRCEPDIALHIPVKLGPRAILWDVEFEGNETLTEEQLGETAEVELGEPVSQLELERARRRLLDAYAEEGFAFAHIDVDLALSPDRTRAHARFIIGEREQVIVKDIVVQGARLTNESLILGRIALEKGQLYRRSLVRDTEERLATLGVFTSVTVTLEDPEVPARDKVVLIRVQERAPQYLDVRPGFSTGQGMRVTFEYGHRNLGGRAIQTVLRVQLGYLPDALILDDDVKRKYDELDLQDRLERRNTVSVELPEIGLGPLFRFGIDAVDVRDNARDFGLTKDALFVRLIYRPTRRFAASIGASLELNNNRIFGVDEQNALAEYLQNNPGATSLLRVAEGKTLAIAQRADVTWDDRDNPFGATRGTFASLGVEHVHADPVDDVATITSEFMRLTNRIAGYVRLNEKGLALAARFAWGLNIQLNDTSQTYPDRLFFVGGVDTLRGFLQSSVVPQDIARQIEADADLPDDDESKLTINEVVVRGGDLMLNPRLELRIPLVGMWQTAVFLDTGNVWVEPASINPAELRYAAGSGIRATTPIGPLAFDVGMNLKPRAWEDLFALHFSVGLF